MDIAYRPARAEDLEDAARVVLEAGNDLRVRHGFSPASGPQPPRFQRFCLAQDPEGLWVAESGGAIVGFGFSWMLEKFWHLSQLFIRPDVQAKGVGQALLSKTLQQAEKNDADNRALITFAYNTASTGLYIKNGLYPREPLYRMVAPAAVVEQNITAADYRASSIVPSPQPWDWLGRLDQEVLGFRRDAHHRFLLGGFAARAIRIEHAGRPAGYAYISAQGHLGPLAVAVDADARKVVGAAVRCALEGRPKQVSMIVPGRADLILRAAGALGFRIEEPYVLMSAQPFGNWSNYLPSSPGYL
jgi:ribosomal protein S18 acetylase RimI-like enzyme